MEVPASPCKYLWIFIAVTSVVNVCVASTMSKRQILKTFDEYVRLNEQYVSAVAANRPYKQLEAELVRFGDGQFDAALSSIRVLACAKADDSLVSALIHVILRTINSASEDPDLALGHIFICQPDSVRRAFQELRPQTQREFYERLANGVIGSIEDDKVKPSEAQRLRRLLDQIAP
jgi:hypothetical protein